MLCVAICCIGLEWPRHWLFWADASLHALAGTCSHCISAFCDCLLSCSGLSCAVSARQQSCQRRDRDPQWHSSVDERGAIGGTVSRAILRFHHIHQWTQIGVFARVRMWARWLLMGGEHCAACLLLAFRMKTTAISSRKSRAMRERKWNWRSLTLNAT